MTMETGSRTPLLDLFQRGEVPRDVRILAARGILAPRAHEQIALLLLLVGDEDAGVRQAAEETLASIPRLALEAFLARSDVTDDVRVFFGARGVSPAAEPAAAAEEPLVETAEPHAESERVRVGAGERLTRLPVIERLKRAMRGGRDERALLIRDHNKIVAAAVLSNPRVNDAEIESFARMPNVSDDVLRMIGNSRAWIKNYSIVQALTKNPRTPLAMSLTLIALLHERDVRLVAADRNVPEPLRAIARKMIFVGKTRTR